MTTTMNNFLGDDLANKVSFFSKELYKAQDLIAKLETENQKLKSLMDQMTGVSESWESESYTDIT